MFINTSKKAVCIEKCTYGLEENFNFNKQLI